MIFFFFLDRVCVALAVLELKRSACLCTSSYLGKKGVCYHAYHSMNT